MSVLSYLERRASAAVLSEAEKSSINTSISTIQNRLNGYFGKELAEHFRFGSSTRGTILPRQIDAKSDIDYMIVFSGGGYTPQTYLDKLRRFSEYYYQKSEIYQSSPTIVLELNHIKFDLVPALSDWLLGYKIPDGLGGWLGTNPNDFNARLTQKNGLELHKIKPTIRLAKIWNVSAGYVWDSYNLEKWIVDLSFSFAFTQTGYLFTVFDNMQANFNSQWRNDRIKRAKQIVAEVRSLEAQNYPNLAEAEVKKLIPEY